MEMISNYASMCTCVFVKIYFKHYNVYKREIYVCGEVYVGKQTCREEVQINAAVEWYT